jgi:RNA polymerase sigma factor (sigma-70 family)
MSSARSSGAVAGQLGSLYSLGAAGGLTDGQLLERFLTRDDPTAAEAAFTALVDRHGAMVLSVCRRELGDLHDAYDAFQATFLVLVSKASTIRHRDSVGGWLFGIARRVSARARIEGARRRRHLERVGLERFACEDGSPSTSAEPEIDYAPLMDEVHRLPERFRAPVVLHYFEGLSAEATAQRLGCARGTVLSRLSRARHRLKKRLESRGASPAVLIPAADSLMRWLPPAPMPAWLAQGTVRAASSLGLAGAAIESVVPAKVAGLSRRVARTLALSRVGAIGSLIVLAVVGVSIGLAATLSPDDQPRTGPAMEAPKDAGMKRAAPREGAKPKAEPVILRGQVLGPDGHPMAGAGLFLSVLEPMMKAGSRRLGATGTDGRFELTVPQTELEPARDKGETGFPGATLAAFSPGLGPDWIAVSGRKSRDPIALRLRPDDVPVEGHVISLEGRPMAGLVVRVAYIAEFPPALLAKLRENAGKMNPMIWGEMRDAFEPGDDGPIRPARTGADGQFRLTGLGRDRVALVFVSGQAIEQSFAMLLTTGDRDYKPIPLPADGSGERKIEGPRFQLAVAPGREIDGIVRDQDTGRPIAGAEITSWFDGIVTTASEGRFHLGGLPRGRPSFVAVNAADQPYIRVTKAVETPQAPGPGRVEITLKRGVWVEGKVIDAASGRPVQAVVTYFPFRDNPHVKDCPDAAFLNNNLSDEPEFRTDAAGRFRAIALPGGGVLAVKASQPGYVFGKRLEDKMAGNVIHVGDFQYYQSPYHALVPIDVPAGERHAIADIPLAPGRTQHIRIVDPEGRPVAGARIFCHQQMALDGNTIAGDELPFTSANPGKAEGIIIVHEGRSLGAVIELKGDEADPVKVALKPTGTVNGRLVDEDGKPRAGVHLAINYHIRTRGDSMGGERHGPLTTGPDGGFRIKDLVPGVSYHVEPIKPNEMNFSLRAEGYLKATHWMVKPGETQDWGDVPVKPYR